MYRLILTLMLAALASSCVIASNDAPYEAIKKAAIKGINSFTKNNGSGVDNPYVGEGFQVYMISPERLLNEMVSVDFASIVTPTGEWYFPVVFGKEERTLLKVAFFEGKWKAVGMGWAGTANEIASLKTTFPASAGYQFRYIKVLQVSSEYIELSQNGARLGLFPLSSMVREKERTPGSFKFSDLQDPKEMLGELKISVRRSLDSREEIQRNRGSKRDN